MFEIHRIWVPIIDMYPQDRRLLKILALLH